MLESSLVLLAISVACFAVATGLIIELRRLGRRPR